MWLISGRIGTSLFTAGQEGLCNRRTPGFLSQCWLGRELNDQTPVRTWVVEKHVHFVSQCQFKEKMQRRMRSLFVCLFVFEPSK